MNEISPEERRLFFMMWERRLIFHKEDEVEFVYKDEAIHGATEAALNDSCLISLTFQPEWKTSEIKGQLISVQDDEIELSIPNLFHEDQLQETFFQQICLRENRNELMLYDYAELWERKNKLFPHLRFCPSVEKDFKKLERKLLRQILLKLQELEEYCRNNPDMQFDAKKLKNATPESDVLEQVDIKYLKTKLIQTWK